MAIALAAATTALAQQPRPLPPLSLDARVFTSRIGQDATTASDLSLPTSDLPSSVRGFAFGGSVYPIRGRDRALGIGAEAVLGRGQLALTGATTGATTAFVHTYISGFAGEVSANFGHREGWSYVSGGAGPMRIETFVGDFALGDPPGKLTWNFGGGARWFNYTHLAFGFDVRFYLTQGNETSLVFAGRGKKRILLISGGFSIK